MSRIVFFCIPAHGHTNPTLGVVRELIARGHEVLYYSYEPMRAKIEAAGAAFIACDAYDTEQKLSPADAARIGKDIAFSTKILVDTTLALDDMVCVQMQKLRPDCIVADSMAIWGKAIALKMGIPFICSTTTFAFNRYSAKVMKRGPGRLFSLLRAMPEINQQLKRLQDKGYPVRSILDILQSDDHTHTIVYTSPAFQPFAETFSKAHYAFVGPSIRPVVQRFEKKQKKLVYISMGTVNNAMLPLYRRCVQALGDIDGQVILSVGEQVNPEAFGLLPENVRVFSQVDQIAVLEQADVFLSHCGMNSVSESLYFGVPLVMFPQTDEQNGVAARVEQLGAGIRLKKDTVNHIHDAVATVLTEPIYREQAAVIAQGFHQCPGAKGAAEKILQVAGEKKEIHPEENAE